jgi:hypothetical protein
LIARHDRVEGADAEQPLHLTRRAEAVSCELVLSAHRAGSAAKGGSGKLFLFGGKEMPRDYEW